MITYPTNYKSCTPHSRGRYFCKKNRRIFADTVNVKICRGGVAEAAYVNPRESTFCYESSHLSSLNMEDFFRCLSRSFQLIACLYCRRAFINIIHLFDIRIIRTAGTGRDADVKRSVYSERQPLPSRR